MINIFNEVYTSLVNVLTTFDANIEHSSVYTNMPSKFPFVSMEEIGNSENWRGMDCPARENYADIDFEINIYTQGRLKKTKADNILQVVDTFFKNLGFIRMSKNNIQDDKETTYRIIVRYSAVVSKDHIVYRR